MTHRIAFPIFALAALAACGNPGSESRTDPPAPPVSATAAVAPSALEAAHKAYLDTDYPTMAERIRDVILDPSSSDLVKENAYELLDKAYEATNGKLPSRLRLPEGYLDLQYGAFRGTTQHGPFYQIMVRGRARDASHLKGLTLRKLEAGVPDEVLLDKQSGKGKFDLRDDEPGYKDFVLELQKVPALPADGVFTLRMEMDDGSVTEGWFIGHGLSSSASPDVSSPAPSASLSEPNPIVSWASFRSPQYALFEHRTFNVWVGRDGDSGLAWNFYAWEPGELTSVKIGAHPGTETTKLVPGDYWLAVTAGEIRSFGPIRLQRGSQTARPFTIR